MTTTAKVHGLAIVDHKTLSAYYPRIHVLRDVLLDGDLSDIRQRHLSRPTDPQDYTELLSQTLICPDDTCDLEILCGWDGAGVELRGTQQESVDRILRDLTRRGGKNVLLAGGKASLPLLS